MARRPRTSRSLPRTIVALEVDTPPLEPRGLERVLRKLSRDFPWALEDDWCVEYWGLRRPGPRSALDGRIRTRGPRNPWPGAPLPVRIVCAWAVHLVLALVRPRAGV